MKIKALDYEVSMPSEEHEEVITRISITPSTGLPMIELEVPAYKENGKVLSMRQSVRMTLLEFGALTLEVAKYINMMEVRDAK
jgi:hypothetical protein